ncbi:hypothetical protein FJ872_33000 [Mesorhizobium sp. B2-5-9]|uniref:hypothetical protein n=1 Tax=Mesorhizobium sp. B2-5-9 TaxID=2589921 RepID=UPI00112B990C|nr:hypothetical protein [Mesorhizobium sp. B2-5-9]TPJ95597.1 hypothetical protein FJ872_33000 [Mesorhizobium sp. B2-5-9]
MAKISTYPAEPDLTGGKMLGSNATNETVNFATELFFDQDNMIDGTDNKNFTATEKTKLAGIEPGADVTDAINVNAAGAVMNSDTDVSGNAWVLDEDTMVSDSATKVPTQQSVKAYVDAAVIDAGGYNDEAAQDAIGSILAARLTYNDATPSIDLSTAVQTSLGKADTALQSASIGATVQGYDVDTAKTDVAQTWTAAQKFAQVGATATAVAALAIDCSAGNFFTKTIAATSTFTVSNVPSARSYAFTLRLTYTSGTITWFSGVNWAGATTPTLTGGKVYLVMFQTDDGGTTWRGAALEFAA